MSGKLTSFKTLGSIVMKTTNELLNNDLLCKYLYYASVDPLSEPIVPDKKENIFNKHIRIIPLLPIAEFKGSVVNILIDTIMSASNNEFYIASIRFDILCPVDQWLIESDQLRPFAIMEEIDKYMKLSHKTSIGVMSTKNVTFIAPTDKFAGYSLFYTGEEFQ